MGKLNSRIYVFESNLAGKHYKGAHSYFAKKRRGAIPGVQFGMHGYSFGIPATGTTLRPLDLTLIRNYIREFLKFAVENKDMAFQVTPIGCDLAGYTPEQIGPMFKGAPANCELPPEFLPFV